MKNYIKRLILATIGAFVLTTSTYAVEPYAFGIKGNFVHSKLTNFLKGVGRSDEEAKTLKDVFFNPGGIFSLYGEYAFHEMIGAGLEAGYFFGRVGRYDVTDKRENYTSIVLQSITLSPYLAIYPFGRDQKEEIGIMYVNIGPDMYIPVTAKAGGQENGKNISNEESEKRLKKDGVKKFGIGARLAVGYEFSFGMTAELKGGYAFTDFFDKEKKDPEKTGKLVEGKKDANSQLWNLGVAFGYNLATLLE
jgi:hypothetical protein